MKKILLSILMLGVLLASFGVVSALDPFPSTNQDNKFGTTNSGNPNIDGNIGPHVNLISADNGEITIEFVMPQNYDAIFEVRIDDNDSGTTPHDGASYPWLDNNEYYYEPKVVVNGGSETHTYSANQKVEIRNAAGAESDWYFDWVTFSLPCEVVVDEPSEDWYNDSVDVEWHYTGDCSIQDQEVWRNNNEMGDLIEELGDDYSRSYLWESSSSLFEESYSMNVCIYSDQFEEPGQVKGCSEEFGIDMTAPEAGYKIFEGPNVSCESEEECDWYINQSSRIQITCDDQGEVQSGGTYEKYWRYSLDGGETWENNWQDYGSTPFSFPEDSEHTLEYYCVDEAGNPSDTESAVIIVDSVAPNITRTVSEPKLAPECEGEDCMEYFNTETEICVSAEDPEPHPVGLESLTCDWWYGETNNSNTNHHGNFTLQSGECFNYTEDSWHTLECYATDSLGNYNEEQWFDVVDAKAPETDLYFEGPYYSNNDGVQWIDTVSRVNLTASDVQPHPVGHVDTYYRVEQVADEYCWGDWDNWSMTSKDSEGWMTYSEPFGVPESCHVIEYYSVDGLDNSESVEHEFVFSDHTAPEVDYSVGEPSYNCDSPFVSCEENWDWKITMNTSVTLSCEDTGAHPSGIDELRYRVIWDGDVESSTWYNTSSSEVTFTFDEPSEHVVEYSCVDNVNKSSGIESVTFKVDGHAFDLDFGNKWSLVSIPFGLLVDDIDEIFGDKEETIEGIWSYDESGWHVYAPEGPKEFTQMEPGQGYWVKTTDPLTVTLGVGELPATSLPEKTVYSGWNLVGHYGLSPKAAECVFDGIPLGEYPSIKGYDSSAMDFYWLDYENDNTEPGKGYWLAVKGETGKSYPYMSSPCPANS